MLKLNKNYGLKLGGVSPTDYRFGKLSKVVINPSRDWYDSLPLYEPQILPSGEDEYGCHIWGTENAIETYLKKIEGGNYNFSERFVYIGTNSTLEGGDPFQTGLWITNNGLVDEDVMPMTQTLAEYIKPKPLPEYLKQQGKLFLDKYEIQQEYVWNDLDIRIPLEEKQKRITEGLLLSPLGISLFAWISDPNGLYYRPLNAPDSHWCVLFKENDDSYSVFDSYDQAVKKIRKDMDSLVCIRYQITKKALPSQSWWSRLISWLLNFYAK